MKNILHNPIVQAVAGIALGALTYGALNGLWLPFGQITAGAAGGFVGGFVASGGNLKAGLFGAVSGGIFAGVANFASGLGLGEGTFGRTALHAFGGGVSNRIQGGDFRDGLLSAGFAQRFAPAVGGFGGRDMAGVIGRTVASAVIGGTASALGGGNFANGAKTAAFARLFNAEHDLLGQVKNSFRIVTGSDGADHVIEGAWVEAWDSGDPSLQQNALCAAGDSGSCGASNAFNRAMIDQQRNSTATKIDNALSVATTVAGGVRAIPGAIRDPNGFLRDSLMGQMRPDIPTRDFIRLGIDRYCGPNDGFSKC